MGSVGSARARASGLHRGCSPAGTRPRTAHRERTRADHRAANRRLGWNWPDAKVALEWLFWTGQITTAYRRGVERCYDLPERVLPASVLNAPTPPDDEAHRELLMVAARCHGIGTLGDLADYFRLRNPQARPRIAELVEDGRLLPVTVPGWRHPAYVPAGTLVPRSARAQALLAPFDPLIWERDRTERLFGFRYRIEIYVPPAKRVHGYYVLPFLMGDRLVGRVDLKADRADSALRVQAAYAEDGVDEAEVATALVTDCGPRRMARAGAGRGRRCGRSRASPGEGAEKPDGRGLTPG